MDKYFATISLCALRYCFGRQTYMPSLVMDFIKRNWQFYSAEDRLLFSSEVAKELQYHEAGVRSLGTDTAAQAYREFLEWMERQEK